MASLNQVGAENLTVSTVAVPLASIPAGRPKRALIYVGANPVRWRADGTAPTSTTGQLLNAGDRLDWTDPRDDADFFGLINKSQFIKDSTAAGDATLAVSYFN